MKEIMVHAKITPELFKDLIADCFYVINNSNKFYEKAIEIACRVYYK